MKVFLSHSTEDAAFVAELDGRMRSEGFTPWLCKTSIQPGDNWIGEIDRGLTEADLVLLVWSPAAAESFATRVEWTSALAREISERRIRLGVVMLQECGLPEVIRTKEYTTGIADTIAWLKARRDFGRGASASAPIYLPDYHSHGLVIRGAYIRKIHRAVVDNPGGFLLTGEPGHGKSILALMFAWSAQSNFDAVVYQTCGERGVDVIAGELADKLCGQLGEDVVKFPPEKKLAAVKQWLKQRRSLLVLDDVWTNLVAVRDLFPGPPVSVLFTSRQRTFPLVANQILTVERFTPGEAEEVFRSYLGDEIFEKHRQALLDFAECMEHLPIAITVGADLLRRKFSPLDAAARKLVLGKLRDVDTLFARAIESQGKPEQRLLAAAAVCAPQGFWMPLAVEIAGLAGDDGDAARDKLVNASLLRVIDQDRQRFQLHGLLREHLRARMVSVKELQAAHVAALEGLFKDHETRWSACRECLEEIVPAAEFLWSQDQISRQANLSYQGYSCAKRIGELDAALRIIQRNEAFWADREGREAQYSLQASYGGQGVILRDWGRLEEAFALHKKEEAICLESGDKNGLQASYGNQGLILQLWGRLDEALALHKKREAICLELGNQDDLQRSYGHQALILEDWGRLDEAFALHKKKEAICLELGNKNSLQVSYGNQANILKTWERLDEALALHKKEESICLELGNKDGLQVSYGNQAVILKDCGRFDEALALHRKQEAICLELGLRSGLGYCYWSWGLLARAQKDPVTAKQKLEAALAIFTELKMPRERDEVRAELNQSSAAEA